MASCASGTAPLDAQDDDIQILSFRPVSKNMAQPKAKTQARLNEALANMMRMSANAKPKMGQTIVPPEGAGGLSRSKSVDDMAPSHQVNCAARSLSLSYPLEASSREGSTSAYLIFFT